ncbi:MAG: hypothetical protein WC309_04340, partial [Candidatus Paceibacterota bacterium]
MDERLARVVEILGENHTEAIALALGFPDPDEGRAGLLQQLETATTVEECREVCYEAVSGSVIETKALEKIDGFLLQDRE